MSADSWVRSTDLETIKSILEAADIDFDEYEDGIGDDYDKTYITLATGISFVFNVSEELLKVEKH